MRSTGARQGARAAHSCSNNWGRGSGILKNAEAGSSRRFLRIQVTSEQGKQKSGACRIERGDDPQKNEPNNQDHANPKTEVPDPEVDVPMEGPEQFEIGSPDQSGRAIGEEQLDDGPALVSERRMHTPVRAPPFKRRIDIRDEKPDTTKVIVGDSLTTR